jgi:hypothetical protein
VKEAGDASFAVPMPLSRRTATPKNSGVRGIDSTSSGGMGLGNYPSPPNSLPHHSEVFGSNNGDFSSSSAIVDGPPLAAVESNDGPSQKSRARRASEGQHLLKGDSKKAAGGELRCEQCGKGYKHSSCLTKHLLVPRLLSITRSHLIHRTHPCLPLLNCLLCCNDWD